MTTFIYKEPYNLISETLKNLSEMKQSKNIILIIGFEERSPNLKET